VSYPANFSKRWIDGAKVRMDSLRKGDVFIDCLGREMTYAREDGGNRGAHWAEDDDGARDCYAGCASVVRVIDLCTALSIAATEAGVLPERTE
jgi:hypothetical protein